MLGENAPAANEMACWPLDAGVLEWHAQRDIIPVGYSPFTRDILETEAVRAIALAHRRTPAQVILRWLIQSGIRPLTSSANPEHIRENLGALDFELTADEMPR